MMSNKGLNSNEALEESTATNSSLTLSGIRREKEAMIALDIKDYTTDYRKYRRARIEARAPLARRDGFNQRKSKTARRSIDLVLFGSQSPLPSRYYLLCR